MTVTLTRTIVLQVHPVDVPRLRAIDPARLTYDEEGVFGLQSYDVRGIVDADYCTTKASDQTTIEVSDE